VTEQVIDLGSSSQRAELNVDYSVREGELPEGPLGFSAGPFRRSNRSLESGIVTVSVSRIRDEVVTLLVCVDPSVAESGVAPGSYQGSVQITDPRLRGQDIPLVLTKQSDHTAVVGLMSMIVAIALGLIGSRLVHLQNRRDASPSESFVTWAKQPGPIIGVALAIAATFAILQTDAIAKTTFGATIWDYFLLVGTMTTAAFTAITGGAAFVPHKPDED
jgi:hypothetical protein